MESKCILPTEIIYKIIFFLCPGEIIRLRSVSKQFHTITRDPSIWKSLYSHARFPRYPGPFSTQSTEFLERTLIQSERLTRSWTTQPMRCISNIELRHVGLSSRFPQLINGRWIIGCKESRKFVVHDVDSGSARILWVKKSGRRVFYWNATSAATDDGLFVYIVFSDTDSRHLSSPWKLLEFRVSDRSNRLVHSLSRDVPTTLAEEIVCLDGRHTPFVHIVTQQVIFDARTKEFYDFPEFRSSLFNNPLNWNYIRTLLTKTHVFQIRRIFDSSDSPPTPLTLIQAFVPRDDSSSTGGRVKFLRLSHEGVSRDCSESYKTIRDAVIDRVTGCTTVRLLQQSVQHNVMNFSCIELTLPNQTHIFPVLPITLNSYEMATLHVGAFGHCQRLTYVESSDDGYARGIVRFSELNRAQPTSDDFAVKFMIDASGQRCRVTLGAVAMIQADKPLPFANLSFDEVRGRLCYTTGFSPNAARHDPVVVVTDIT